jgi:LuxR family transcriptional regulator, maltose regulon positive regulatory protein
VTVHPTGAPADLVDAHNRDVACGRESLARGEWDEARLRFERALTRAETAEAYEGLGLAAWWLDDVTTMFDARRQAFRMYWAAGDRQGAARVATALSSDHLLAGERAICRGWLQRAHRLVEDLDPCPEQGWLAILDAHLALMIGHDAAAAERASIHASSLGRQLADVDLEMLGLAYQGLALSAMGCGCWTRPPQRRSQGKYKTLTPRRAVAAR